MNIIQSLEKQLLLELLIIGLEEPVLIKGLGAIKAKVDSGNAGHNVIHGEDFQIEGDVLNFTTFASNGEKRRVQYPIDSYIDVNIGSGNIQHRPVILLDIKFADEEYKKIPFSVTDRSTNSNPILISKNFVRDELNALIDVSKTNISNDNIQVEIVGEANNAGTNTLSSETTTVSGGKYNKPEKNGKGFINGLRNYNQFWRNVGTGNGFGGWEGALGSLGLFFAALSPIAAALVGGAAGFIAIKKLISFFVGKTTQKNDLIREDRPLLLGAVKKLIERYEKDIDPNTQKNKISDQLTADIWKSGDKSIRNWRLLDYQGYYFLDHDNRGLELKSEEKRIGVLKKLLKNAKMLNDPKIKQQFEKQLQKNGGVRLVAAAATNFARNAIPGTSKNVYNQSSMSGVASENEEEIMKEVRQIIKDSGLALSLISEATINQPNNTTSEPKPEEFSDTDMKTLEELKNAYDNRHNFMLYYICRSRGDKVLLEVIKNNKQELISQMDEIIEKTQFNGQNFVKFVRTIIQHSRDLTEKFHRSNKQNDMSAITGVCYGEPNNRRAIIFEKDHNLLFLQGNARETYSLGDRLQDYSNRFLNGDFKLLKIDTKNNPLYNKLAAIVNSIKA